MNTKNAKPRTIDDEIKAAFDRLTEVHATIAVRMLIEHPQYKIAEVNDLQSRLEYRMKQAELAVLRDKVDIYEQVCEILKP